MNNIKEINKTSCQVILINDRFFSSFGAGGRVQTSWSLSGAKLYLVNDNEMTSDKEKLEKKGKVVEIHTLSIEKTMTAEKRNELLLEAIEPFKKEMKNIFNSK